MSGRGPDESGPYRKATSRQTTIHTHCIWPHMHVFRSWRTCAKAVRTCKLHTESFLAQIKMTVIWRLDGYCSPFCFTFLSFCTWILMTCLFMFSASHRGVTVSRLANHPEWPSSMALTEASGDPIASRWRRPPSATDMNDSCHPLASAAPPDDCPPTEGEEDVTGCRSRLRPSHNGGLAIQNGSLRNLPPSSPSIQPQSLCCQHCHFHPDLICPCGQPECPLQQNHGAGSRLGPLPSSSSCPCYLSYSNHPHHSASPLCLHQHHQQSWQEHLQNQTARMRYVSFVCLSCTTSCISKNKMCPNQSFNLFKQRRVYFFLQLWEEAVKWSGYISDCGALCSPSLSEDCQCTQTWIPCPPSSSWFIEECERWAGLSTLGFLMNIEVQDGKGPELYSSLQKNDSMGFHALHLPLIYLFINTLAHQSAAAVI